MKTNFSSMLSATLIAGLSLNVLSSAQAQFTYTFFPNNATVNSGVSTDFAIVGYVSGSYNDDFTRNFSGPSSPTIDVVDGADIPDMEIFHQSNVRVSGGTVSAILYDNSTIHITGGSTPFILGFDHSFINMKSGSANDLEGQGRGINVSGGTINNLVANVDSDPFGNSFGSCIVNVFGGDINESSAYNDGILNLYGGKLGSVLRAAEGGTINIYGNDLVATLFNPSFGNGYSLYSLSGTLEDGNTLNNTILRVRNDGVTYGHSSFNLIDVPEPGVSALLLGTSISGAGLIIRRRIRK